MTTALVVQPVAETSILRVPLAWRVFPPDWLKDMAFWYLLDAIRAQENVILSGPPYDIEWTFAQAPEDLDPVVLRHPCDDCHEAVRQAKLLLTVDDIDKKEVIALVQFTQNYIYDIAAIPTEYAVSGPLAQTEVDLGHP